jgi:TetR/AcrR family transcriptional repressor of nem operon
MRYSKEHKAETHARIVKHASSQLRKKGTQGIGVADLMKEAGLTHGGFYAHFESRDDLVVQALAHAMDQTSGRWARASEGLDADARLALLIAHYLTPAHRDGVAQGCAIAALAGDVAREGGKARRTFAGRIEAMVEQFAGGTGEPATEESRRRAIAVISTLVGALAISRVAGHSAFSQEVLDAGREAATLIAGEPKAPAKPRVARKPTKTAKAAPRKARKLDA